MSLKKWCHEGERYIKFPQDGQKVVLSGAEGYSPRSEDNSVSRVESPCSVVVCVTTTGPSGCHETVAVQRGEQLPPCRIKEHPFGSKCIYTLTHVSFCTCTVGVKKHFCNVIVV